MVTNRESSEAWLALSAASRKMLVVIERAIAERGSPVELAYSHFLDAPPELAISRPVIRHCIRRLAALHFVELVPHRRINTFALSDGWRAIDKTSAKKRLARAKATKPRPAPRQLQLGEKSQPKSLPKMSPEIRRSPPEPEPEVPQYKTPGLPVLKFMQGWDG